MNKNTKIYYNGKLIEGKFRRFVLKVKSLLRKLFIACVLLGVAYALFWLGGRLNPAVVYTKAEVIKEVPLKSKVLERIAKCESTTGHYENGQVVMRSNNNRSVDIGKYQINNFAWGKKATELGYNLVVEADNEAMANWIYTNRGTEDWSASKKCWNK